MELFITTKRDLQGYDSIRKQSYNIPQGTYQLYPDMVFIHGITSIEDFHRRDWDNILVSIVIPKQLRPHQLKYEDISTTN